MVLSNNQAITSDDIHMPIEANQWWLDKHDKSPIYLIK